MLLLAAVLLLSGCWNRRELETLGIIIGAGYDWDSDSQEYVVTAQMARAEALRPEGGGGGGGGAPSHVFTGRGKTVFDASRNLSLVATRKLWWGHVQVVVVGEAAARRGLVGALNFMQRDGETRTIYWVMITRGRAADILHARASPEAIPAVGLQSLMRTAGATSYSPAVRLLDVIRNLESPSAFLIGVVGLAEARGSLGGRPVTEFRLDGSGVFVKDRLAGYLEPKESRGILWLRGKVKSALITVPCPGSPGEHVGIEVIHTGVRLEPHLDQGGRPWIDALIRMEGNIGDQDCTIKFDKQSRWDELESRVREAIRSEIRQGLQACKELNADCAGIGNRIQQELPAVWKRLESKWPEPLAEMPIQVQTDVVVRATGAEIRPVKPK